MKNEVFSKIEKWSRKTPNQAAVIAFGEVLTYRALVESSLKLAAYLQGRGLNQRGFIGIYLSQSHTIPICMLASWILGVPYVPLDPNYPQDRILNMVKNLDLSCILTNSEFESLLDVKIPLVNVEESMGDNMNDTHVSNISSKSHLAYLIFTSGTTGNPKGVKVTVENLANVLNTFEKKLAINHTDRFLSIASFSFDIFGLELLLPLICGATCIFSERSAALNSTQLLDQLATDKISLFQATPSTYQLLIQEPWPHLSLRHLLCGGEFWSQKLAKGIFKNMPKTCKLWNVYGPTETTIWSSLTQVFEGEDIFLSPSVNETYFFVLDKDFNPVEKGELYIGGKGVSDGYYKDECLTKNRFIETPHIRLYKTGDIVQRVTSENLIFVGREDHQVKIRGFRVELGDIEQALLKHRLVSRVVVVYDYVKYSDERSLVACIEEKEPKPEELRQFLMNKLPFYMVPQFFIWFEKLPFDPNLKIDRKQIRSQLRVRFSYFEKSGGGENSRHDEQESLIN